MKQADRALFKRHLLYWRDRLSLNNYRIEIEYDGDSTGADTLIDHKQLVAVITIGKTDELYTIPYLARHEMLEVLLAPLWRMIQEVYSEAMSQRAAHQIIHRLERILPVPTDEEVKSLHPIS